jgi:hypothetical protein
MHAVLLDPAPVGNVPESSAARLTAPISSKRKSPTTSGLRLLWMSCDCLAWLLAAVASDAKQLRTSPRNEARRPSACFGNVVILPVVRK